MKYPCIAPTGATHTRFQEEPRYQEGLYDLGRDLYAWMVPNGSWGESNAGLLVGRDRSCLIDTLWDLPKTRTMLAAMEAVTQEAKAPLSTVVNTHSDGDHFWGNELVKELDIVTSKASYQEMLGHHPRSLLLFEKLGKAMSALPLGGNGKAGHWFQQMVRPYDFAGVTHTPAKRTFEGELSLEVGGRTLQLIEVGPAHTTGDLMVYIPDAGVLFTGDILFIGSTPVMWAGPIDNWLKALDRIEALEPSCIVPGHGPVTDLEGVAQVRRYWQFVAQEGQERYERGMKPKAAAREIVASQAFRDAPFARWNSPERMMTNIHTLYRNLSGDTRRPTIPQLLLILRNQALLAHELPHAQPQCMRMTP